MEKFGFNAKMVNLKCEDEEEDDEEEDQEGDEEGDQEGDEDKEDLGWCEEGRPVSECLRH